MIPGVAKFNPEEVYSRAALREMLKDIIDPDTFLDGLKIPKRFRNAILGADILKALQNPPEQAEEITAAVQPIRRATRSQAGKRAPFQKVTIHDLDRHANSVKNPKP